MIHLVSSELVAFSLKFVLNWDHKTLDVIECVPQKGALGKAFKQDAKVVIEHLSNLTEEKVTALEHAIAHKG